MSDNINEDQIKSPTGKHRRDQTSFRSSFGPSVSFGGVGSMPIRRMKKDKESTKKSHEDQRDEIEEIAINEGIEETIKNDKLHLLYRQGRLVDGRTGEVLISNHADLLDKLIGWYVDHDLPTLKKAIYDIAAQIKHGAEYVDVKSKKKEIARKRINHEKQNID